MTKTAKEYLGAEKAGEAEKAFAERLPGKRLLALHLDGFSHTVIYDDVPKGYKPNFVDVSFCMGEAEELSFCKSHGTDPEVQKAARAFLRDIGYDHHSSFQGNATEVRFVEPEDR